MSEMGLGRVKTLGERGFLCLRGGWRFEAGYARIAAISGWAPIMLITLVMLSH